MSSQGFQEEIIEAITNEKAQFVMSQLKLLKDSTKLGNPVIRCGCQRKVSIQSAFRCLYCGEWYCQTCGEIHFGMTREQWAREQSVLDINKLDIIIGAQHV